MKSRYEIDQRNLSDMDVEIAFNMPLKHWGELACQIEAAEAGHPASQFLAQLRTTIRKIETTTSTRWEIAGWNDAKPADD